MDVTGGNVVVIGAGVTGRSTARFLSRRGATVRLVDRSAEALDCLGNCHGVKLVVDDGTAAVLRGADLVVPSPGVPRTHPLLRAALAQGLTIVSEIELAYCFLTCPLLAVTGTNGKSTTTNLLGAMLRADGAPVFVGGNLGTPLIDAVQDDSRLFAAAVAEVSSFQLEWVVEFRPRIAVLLNLTPDHLDRYASIEEYGSAKAAILTRQQPGDIVVLNRNDPWVWEQRERTRATTISFGYEAVEFGGFMDGDELVFRGADPTPLRFSLARTRLQGAHNRENMLAAVTAACAWGVPAPCVQRVLEETEGLPHRLELVRERCSVRYFDDSKGTNVGAVVKSLESFAGSVILLAGGYDKGGDFSVLRPLLSARVKQVCLFGAARSAIARQIDGAVNHLEVPTLESAIVAAAAVAAPGDVVLLSPGCASFDEFTDYAARGRHFRTIVEGL